MQAVPERVVVTRAEVSPHPGKISRIWLARGIAIAADFLQIAIFPFFIAGAMSPADDILDIAVAALMVWLVGWHIAFLPSAVTKLLPVIDLAPTWTIAVFISTRTKSIGRAA